MPAHQLTLAEQVNNTVSCQLSNFVSLFSLQDFTGECRGCVEFQAVSINYPWRCLKGLAAERIKCDVKYK